MEGARLIKRAEARREDARWREDIVMGRERDGGGISNAKTNTDPEHLVIRSKIRSLLAPTTMSSSPEPHRSPPHVELAGLAHPAPAPPHIRTSDARLGSPSSIPSSPTSIHSSSSAIFERDIEPLLLPPSPPHPNRPLDPHRIPRARATEQLESSVPSVLDSAAAALTSDTEIAVLAPLSPASLFDGRASGFASPLSLRSRSPSPSPRRPDSMLLSSVQPIARSVSGGSQVASSPPSVGGSVRYDVTDEGGGRDTRGCRPGGCVVSVLVRRSSTLFGAVRHLGTFHSRFHPRP
ncbi:hypothetical protein D9611_014727 [Ephemerocybe angulata]|uniref:Uncharacterized protein n=1 Tax=Ephemerocybe angulata TaxID=980116 RepID=A0A8H5BB03_9AGAR|nr:hypothetical protein D9611_014727 [Tulosesus angulatus]